MPANPVRNRVIEYLLRQQAGVLDATTAAAIASIAASAVSAAPPPSIAGDAAGSANTVGEIEVIVQEIHGEEITPPSLTGTEDDYAPEGAEALLWRLDPAGNTLTGFAAPVTPGEVHLLKFLSAGTLAHEDAGSAAENRFDLAGATDMTVPAGALLLAVYDGTGLRWAVGGGAGGGSLDALSDVVLTAPVEDEQLQYIGGQWVNNARRWEPVTTNPGGGPELVWDGDDLVMNWTAY